jgi:glycosyltransferase involved in cell wall biosynthesis
MEKEKIGVGVITCNRVPCLVEIITSLRKCKPTIDNLIVVNDGDYLDDMQLPDDWVFLQNQTNQGVAKSKNKAIKHLFDEDCKYIFIIEDDMLIKDETVFTQYVNAYKETGIHHFNYGPGSPFNCKIINNINTPNPRLIVDYKECKIALYENPAAKFSFFTSTLIEEGLGYMCEDFDNYWEHISSTNYIIKAGYHPPFWWFADLANSHLLIGEYPNETKIPAIDKEDETWKNRVISGREIYKNKHGYYPNQTPSSTKEEVLEILKSLKKNK